MVSSAAVWRSVVQLAKGLLKIISSVIGKHNMFGEDALL